jgi:drug/metabolite transporter (DMT)-like permease
VASERQALFYGLAAVLCWSTVATAFKVALRELDVLQMLLIASICSTLFLLAILVVQQRVGLLVVYFAQAPWFFFGMGVLNPLAYYLILFHAYDLLPAQQAMAINYSWALTLALLAIPLLGQRLRPRDIAAALVAYSGILVIATQGDLAALHFENAVGVGYALLSTVLWSLYWIFNTRNQRDAVASLCLNFLIATPFIVGLCFTFSSLPTAWGPSNWAAVYIGVFEMGFAFVLWSSALKLTKQVARIGNLIFLSPILSLVLISNVLGEAIHTSTLVGLALILPATLWQQSQSGGSAAGKTRDNP